MGYFQNEKIEKLEAEISRLNDIITLWIDCCLNLDADRYFVPENKIVEVRNKLRKARRATYKEETRRKENDRSNT